jgi:hypothetical protein
MHGRIMRTTAGSVSWRPLESGSCQTAQAMLRSVLVRPGQDRLFRTPEADETCEASARFPRVPWSRTGDVT